MVHPNFWFSYDVITHGTSFIACRGSSFPWISVHSRKLFAFEYLIFRLRLNRKNWQTTFPMSTET